MRRTNKYKFLKIWKIIDLTLKKMVDKTLEEISGVLSWDTCIALVVRKSRNRPTVRIDHWGDRRLVVGHMAVRLSNGKKGGGAPPLQVRTKRGRGGLVLRFRDRRAPGLKPDFTEDPSCMWACACLVQSDVDQTSPRWSGVAVWRGRGQLRCSGVAAAFAARGELATCLPSF
ncbi:hypothetical protein AVEN_250312-1 [Araneus ventricosus]|uniref:Uncharacterized protein n=1 Tax=Araneus ventricosus TaxID=182803 RepID=A0A4Y2FHD5_ARAVE|nr:hypothetical protein AVEN_250312-1 [Araneus ventricosus]